MNLCDRLIVSMALLRYVPLEQANLSKEGSVWVTKAWGKPKIIPSPRMRTAQPPVGSNLSSNPSLYLIRPLSILNPVSLSPESLSRYLPNPYHTVSTVSMWAKIES